MLKKYWKPIFYISLVFLALLVLSVIVLRSQKLETDTCTRLEFQGEYSQAGGPWLPLVEKHAVSSLKGDVVLRGHFSADIPAGETLNVYLNHVDYCLLVNGTEVHRSDSHTRCVCPTPAAPTGRTSAHRPSPSPTRWSCICTTPIPAATPAPFWTCWTISTWAPPPCCPPPSLPGPSSSAAWHC